MRWRRAAGIVLAVSCGMVLCQVAEAGNACRARKPWVGLGQSAPGALNAAGHYAGPVKAQLTWEFLGPRECLEAFHIRFGPVGGAVQTAEIRRSHCGTYENGKPLPHCAYDVSMMLGTRYVGAVQACNKHPVGRDECSSWGSAPGLVPAR